MAALSVSCIQQREFTVGKCLKSVNFLEQIYQNSLENCAQTLLGLVSLYAVCRPLAVEADKCLLWHLIQVLPPRTVQGCQNLSPSAVQRDEKSLCPGTGGATTKFAPK